MPAVEKDLATPLSGPGHSGGKLPLANSSDANTPTVGLSSIWQRIRRDLLLLGAGNLSIVVAQLGFRSILITALAPTDYGRLSLILGIYNTVWIIGASGIPSSVARYIAIIAPADDSAIIRSAVRASAWPVIVATVVIATISGILLHSLLASLFAAVGLSSLVYSLLTLGILRGRGRIGFAASIMPIAAVAEVAPLVILLLSGAGVTPLSAFVVFCLGNVAGLIAGIFFAKQTAPPRSSTAGASIEKVPSSRQLLSFSMWLGAATAGVAVLPLIIRAAAVLDSYTVVAIVDIAIVLLSVPQRLGATILLAVVPHVTRDLNKGNLNLTISRRENLLITIPFVVASTIVAFTPIVGWMFDAVGRPVYAKSAVYLALALLAGPARILYGVVEGVLIAYGDGRFLAFNSLLVTGVASAVMVTAIALGSTVLAFCVFVAAFWMIYLFALARIGHLASNREPSPIHN